MNEIFTILDNIEKTCLSETEKSYSLVDAMKAILNDLKSSESFSDKSILNFIDEQISFLTISPEKYRYSPNTLIFASMLNIISPQAYKFIRNSGLIILPHPSTINKLNSKISSNPQKEQQDSNFLEYAKQRVLELKNNDIYVSLMMDEIHLKPYVDYKGGDIVGMSYDNSDIASSAYVFMINSIFSKYKDVIHILPVKKLTADKLFETLMKVITGLEKIGFKVIVIVSDNNSINRKAVSFFNNPLANYVYPHPCDRTRPLFYCIDSVHLIKCVRNNWLNQKNSEQAMYYPDFNLSSGRVCTASFDTLKSVFEMESGNLLKHGYTLSRKSLWPTSFEKQNVKLALEIFNSNLSKGLNELDGKCNIVNLVSTSKYIEIFTIWFDIMNVKSPNKGQNLRNKFCEPLSNSNDDEKLAFMQNFLEWLLKWEALVSDTGRLTKETHSALALTTKCMIELTHYCVLELNMPYILPGKIQTDELESRFGLYRRLAGTQYHISIRQIYEVESKLRAFSTLKELSLDSSVRGQILVNELFCCETDFDINQTIILNDCFSKITVSDKNINDITSKLPLIAYIAGYCIHSVLNRLKCSECKSNLTTDETLSNCSLFKIIHNVNRGGLKFPAIEVLNVIVHNFIVVQNILSSKSEVEFLKVHNQRQLITHITFNILTEKDMNIVTCNTHSPHNIMKQLIYASTNTLLKNYCKSKNDEIKHNLIKKSEEKAAKKRKLKTLEN
jgi:hypothetical protein